MADTAVDMVVTMAITDEGMVDTTATEDMVLVVDTGVKAGTKRIVP